MGFVSRVGAFTNGTANDGTEVDAEFDNVIATINGNIDNANIAAGAAIAYTKLAEIDPSKVGDYSATAAQLALTSSPGDTGSPNLATDLRGELTHLRSHAGKIKGYASTAQSPFTFYMNSGLQNAAWFEPAITGKNLAPNPGFEAPLVGGVPPGFVLMDSPATVAITSAAHPDAGKNKRALHIVTNAANEGVSFTVGGLKKSAKYLVGARYSLTTGTLNIDTQGGLASGAYMNLAMFDSTPAPTAVETLQGIVKTTSTPDSLVVRIFGTASGADFKIHDVWLYELLDAAPVELPWIPTQTADHNTTETITDIDEGHWENISELSLSAYVPFQGYRLIYEVALSWTSPTNTNTMNEYAFRIQSNDGGGATTVEGPYSQKCGGLGTSDEVKFGGTLFMRYVLDNPTAGLTYAMTFDVHLEGTDPGGDLRSDTIELNPTVNTDGGTLQTVSRARLLMERL